MRNKLVPGVGLIFVTVLMALCLPLYFLTIQEPATESRTALDERAIAPNPPVGETRPAEPPLVNGGDDLGDGNLPSTASSPYAAVPHPDGSRMRVNKADNYLAAPETTSGRQEVKTIFNDMVASLAPSPKIYSKLPKVKESNRPISLSEDNPLGRANWFMYQRMYPFFELPENARRRALDEARERALVYGPDSPMATWNLIGPLPTTSAFPNNGGVTSGRIPAIAVSPANNQIVLIGTAIGGIWRSTNGGTTFTPVSDTQADLAVGSIAFSQSNPNIVYAAMGDNDQNYFGTGVLKSMDAGATWARVNNTSFGQGQQLGRKG